MIEAKPKKAVPIVSKPFDQSSTMSTLYRAIIKSKFSVHLKMPKKYKAGIKLKGFFSMEPVNPIRLHLFNGVLTRIA